MKKLIVIIPMFFLFLIAGKSQEQEYSFKENYKVSSPTKLKVSILSGNIAILPSEKDEIEVSYLVKKNNKVVLTDKKSLKKNGITLKVKQDENMLNIMVYSTNRNLNNEINLSKRVDLEILVPRKTACDLFSLNGDILVRDLENNLDCRADNGNVDIYGITGYATVVANDGRINLEKINGNAGIVAKDVLVYAKDIEGELLVKTNNKNVHIDNISGKVYCSTNEGGIDLQNITGLIVARTNDGTVLLSNTSGQLNVISKNGNIIGNIPDLNGSVFIEAKNGNIDITIPDSIGLDLNIKGKLLAFPNKNFNGLAEKKAIKGKVNGGGTEVNLSAENARVELSYQKDK